MSELANAGGDFALAPGCYVCCRMNGFAILA